MIFAVLPLKPFAQAKSRLGRVLDDTQRRALAKAMAQDVLATLNAVPDIFRILIISDEPEIAGLAAGLRATCLRDAAVAAEPGLNAVLAGAASYLTGCGAAAMLVVPGDLPRLRPDDVARFIAGWQKLPGLRRLALAPAHDGGGTNLLLAGPPEAIEFSYGPESFAAHVRFARQLGNELAILELDGAAMDIDEPADLEALPGSGRLGRHTAALLRSGALGAALRRRLLARELA